MFLLNGVRGIDGDHEDWNLMPGDRPDGSYEVCRLVDAGCFAI